jgi:hypothetical protein
MVVRVSMTSRKECVCGEVVGEGYDGGGLSVEVKYLSWSQAPPPTARRVNVIVQREEASLG